MKICFINNIYGQTARGGAEKVIEHLVNWLQTAGHDLTIISGAVQKNISTENKAGINYILVPSQYSNLSKYSYNFRLLFHIFSFINIIGAGRIGKIIKQENFDLVWTHNLIGLNLLAFKFLGSAKKIHTFHDIQLLHPSGLIMYQHEDMLNSRLALIYQLLVKWVFPKDALGIFPSAWLRSIYAQCKFLPEKNMVLKNPINFKSSIKSEVGDNKDFTFLYLGQLEVHKGIELLIDSFNNLNISGAKLLIAGTGSLNFKLKQDNLNNKNIIFLGKVETADIALAKADCLVIPSLCYENLPTVALEAANYGLPVIGSNLGGIPKAIGDESLLFAPTKTALTAKLNWCLTNPEELKKVAALARQQIKIPSTELYLAEIEKKIDVKF